MDQRGVAQPVMALPRTVRHHMSIRATCRLWRDLLDANRQVVWQLDGPNRWRDPEWLAELRIDGPMERYIARVWDERRRPYEVALAGWPRYTLLAWMAEWPRDEQWAGRIVERCGSPRALRLFASSLRDAGGAWTRATLDWFRRMPTLEFRDLVLDGVVARDDRPGWGGSRRDWQSGDDYDASDSDSD